jgi:hypothetical protein
MGSAGRLEDSQATAPSKPVRRQGLPLVREVCAARLFVTRFPFVALPAVFLAAAFAFAGAFFAAGEGFGPGVADGFFARFPFEAPPLKTRSQPSENFCVEPVLTV